MRELAGTVAVVTGGGSGIGLATATRLAAAGASVAVVDRDGERGRAGRRVLGGFALRADVGRSEEWPGIVEAVSTRFGGIDLAHLNAGVMTGESDITALSDEAYRRVLSGSTSTGWSTACGPWSRPWPPGAEGPWWPRRHWPASSASPPTPSTA